MVSISPHWGHGVPWRMLSPSDQKAGQMPWRLAPAAPSLRRDCTISWPPAGAVKAGFVSIRQDVHWPLLSCGVMMKEPLPESAQLAEEVVYVSCSPLDEMPVQIVHFDVSSDVPLKSSDQITLKPAMVSGAVASETVARASSEMKVLPILEVYII